MDPSPPWLIAQRYELRERIGRGAFGVVHRAHHRGLRADVALKLVPAAHATPRTIERLARESQRAFAVSAPTLARALDAGYCHAYGTFYLALELVSGEPLAARIARKGPRPHAEVAHVVGDVARALAALHRARITHRDVTPHNVVVQTDAHDRVTRAVLVDLGSSWHPTDAHARLTSEGVVIGSTGYLAPELATAARITPAADQYALACIAYELAEAARPFEAEHPLALLARHAVAARPLARSLPPAAARAVRRAMHVDPASRFEDVIAFATTLASRAPPERAAARPGLARVLPHPSAPRAAGARTK